MYNIKGDNPTQLYRDAMFDLIYSGDEVRPRGKLVKELRPAAIEFEDPTARMTFLGGRKINPFFQVAESFWILSGCSDVEWLTQFNANMASFSDDGIDFNAPYGERIVRWGDNNAHDINQDYPVDQLVDVYKRLVTDPDTRQATIAIGNPSFDNYKYLHEEKGKDIACNLYITFKIRNNKLNMTVFNRSNDLHWGTFGANLCQFTTTQETIYSWLKNSGLEEFSDLELGEYCQFTDSLHIYMEDYGAKATENVIAYEEAHPEYDGSQPYFKCKNEPRMSLNIDQFYNMKEYYWDVLDKFISYDEHVNLGYVWDESALNCAMNVAEKTNKLDHYWRFVFNSMLAYKYYKTDKLHYVMRIMDNLDSCRIKISMLYFIKSKLSKVEDEEEYNGLKKLYEEQVEKAKESLDESFYGDKIQDEITRLEEYLSY